MTETIYKTCTKCKTSKPIFEFNKDKRNKSGLNNKCKVCMKLKLHNRQNYLSTCRQHYLH